MQLSILKKHRAAIFFSFAACITEFVYAGITVQFHIFLNNNPSIAIYFRIITSIALIVFGLWNSFSKATSSSTKVDTKVIGKHGFLKGLLLGLLNPMTIPFWLAITTYLVNNDLVRVTELGYWVYLIGLALGTFCLLLTVDALGKQFTQIADDGFLVHKVPGFIFIGLGVYFLLKLIL